MDSLAITAASSSLVCDMALDNGYHFAAQTLPTPTDTPYESPTTNIPRQPSYQGSSSPLANYSPLPIPSSEDSYFPKQQGNTEDGRSEKGPLHESRRFAPNNLGISLISQIHSLRKELGSKNNMVESLEEGLHSSRAENEQLTKDLKTQAVEVTSVKKQMQSLETDMLRALEDIAKEKDNAVETLADTRKRLEDSRKKGRAQEEDVNRAHTMWEKEREDWDDQKRRMEGRIHMLEERLKTMVAETLVMQNAGQSKPELDNDMDEDAQNTWYGEGNDDSDIHAMSRLSDRSLDELYDSKAVSNFRSSRLSGLHDLGGSQMSGLSLAEELELGEDEVAVKEQENDQDALPEETYTLVGQYSEDKNARRVMAYNVDQNEDHVGDESSGQHSIGIINDYIDIPENQPRYTDTASQFTPPSSPTLQIQEPGVSGKPVEQTERTANQSRKRIAIPQIFVEHTPALKATETKVAERKAFSMTSTGSQTVGQPEDHAIMPQAAKVIPLSVPALAHEMISESTQTTEDPTPALDSATFRPLHSATDVPVIAIHPPASRPSSSRNSVMLPPRTKNAACQVAIELPRNIKSTSMQTEEISFGKQPVSVPLEVPLRLAPFDQSAQPPLQLTERRKQAKNVSGSESLRHNPWGPPQVRAAEKEPSTTNDGIRNAYFGKNDDGPLNDKQRSGPRRPIRSGSILAGFDYSSENDLENVQEYFSDDELLNSAPIRKTLSKVENSWRLVPHVEDSVLERLESASEGTGDEKYVSVPNAAITESKASSQVRSKTCQIGNVGGSRKAFTSNGTKEHAQRDRSPSRPDFLGDLGKEPTVAPPFPVPARSSSRNITLSASDGAASPSPNTTTFFRGPNYRRPLARPKVLRKVQSAAAVAQPPMPYRPQPLQSLSASSTLPPSPKSPAPRRNQFILPYDSVVELESNSAQPQTRTGETAIETTREETSVVDAIAQTMVGEWMWKYIRKRTSFGITERPQAEFDMGRNGETGNSNGVRHKRWVWLAPFERSVIWSSKQPTSGPALLGKGGRKRTLTFRDLENDSLIRYSSCNSVGSRCQGRYTAAEECGLSDHFWPLYIDTDPRKSSKIYRNLTGAALLVVECSLLLESFPPRNRRSCQSPAFT